MNSNDNFAPLSSMFNLNRRKFLQSAIASTSASALLSLEAEAAVPEASTFKEPAQSLPIKDEVDVMVCGAGPAGVSAAITAARAGDKPHSSKYTVV